MPRPPVRESNKPTIFKHIYDARVDPVTGEITDPLVDSAVLKGAIEVCNGLHGFGFSTDNPANFLKDYLRSPRRNDLWPQELKDKKITVRQKYRNKRVFAFAKYADDQVEPFPDPFKLADDSPYHTLEAVSLPSDARALGREDEAWLIQVCVHQRLVQTHFALYSPLQVVDLFHLQNSVKATPEIDAIFLITYLENGQKRKALATFEAKRDEPLLPDQIRAQVAYMAKQCQQKRELRDVDVIIPVAARSEVIDAARTVSLFAMSPIAVTVGGAAFDAESEHLIRLDVAGKGVGYRFRPAVGGI